MNRQLLVLIMFGFASLMALGQSNSEAIYRKNMDNGVDLMEQGEYERADSIFREVLQNLKILPSDMAFYFGKNSYYLGRYKQSINWLNKYIELKGTQGQYFDESKAILGKASEAFRIEQAARDEETRNEMEEQVRVDCEMYGKVICPVCEGKTVIIKKGYFGERFYTCPYSDDHGYLTCEEYRLLLQGELKPKR